MSFGSSKFRALNNFQQGTAAEYPLFKPGAKTWYVAPSAYRAAEGVAPSDGPYMGETPQQPLLTITQALVNAVADRGDTIVLLPGSYTIDGARAFSKNGIRLVALQPYSATLNFATSTAAGFVLSATDIEIAGIIFVCNIANQVNFIEIAAGAHRTHIHHCYFREGSATGLSMVEWTGIADDVLIDYNEFYAPTAGNYDEAILMNGSTSSRASILWNVIQGDFDEGSINGATSNVMTLVDISYNRITNTLNAAEAVDLNSAVTGIFAHNLLGTDAVATAGDLGSLENFDNWFYDDGATDQAATPYPTSPVVGGSSLTQIADRLGADADTDAISAALYGAAGIAAFPASAAPANAVSMAEVLREIYDQDEKVAVKAAATMVNGTTLFTIAGGPIQIMELYAYCATANDGTASTLQYSSTPTLGSAKTLSGASASLASAAAGASVALNQTSLAQAPDLVTAANGGVAIGANVANKMIVNAGIITSVIGVGSTTGTWSFHLRYKPLARGVTVV